MELNIKKKEDQLEVSLEGLERIFVLNTDEIKEELSWCLSIYHTKLVINFKGVKFIDTAGFTMLIELYQDYNTSQKDLILKNISAEVQELFELVKVDTLFKWEQTPVAEISHAA